MSYSSRAEQLLRKPGLARLIQIVSIVKQSIAADEVFVLRPIQSSGSAVPILWQDRIHRKSDSTVNTASTRSRAILSHDELITLSTLHEASRHLSIHFFQDGHQWPQAAVEYGDVQAIRLQYLIAGQIYLLVWARGSKRHFNERDREAFVSLCQTIAIADEESDCDSPLRTSDYVSETSRESAEPVKLDLTPTEYKVFQLLKQGLTEKAVAQRLHRSRHTIHSHVRIIYRKLSVNSKKELIKKVFH